MFDRNITAAVLDRLHTRLAVIYKMYGERRVDSSIHVLSVGVVDLALLQRGEVEEVRGPVDFMVELFGVGQLEVVLHVGVMAHAC